MQIGAITIGGRVVGSVTLSEGSATPDAQPAPILASYDAMDFAPGTYGRSEYEPGTMARPRHHSGPDHGQIKGAYPELDVKDSTSYGGSKVYGRFAEARDRARQELKAKPWLNEKAMHIFAGENPDPEASTALWEETINRAAVRGTSLEKELRHTSEGGYYAGWRDQVSPATRKVLEASRDRALNYSNISNYATDNSSGGLARREREQGIFPERQVYNREHFFGPDNRIPEHGRAWRDLVNESEAKRAADPSASTAAVAPDISGQPGRVPGVDPQAFIMHHTGGGGTPAGVENTLRERGLGVEYIMDREGHITPYSGAGASHMMSGWGKGEGLNNRNTVGMEVIARDDKDVTPAQVAAAKAFIAKNYPTTPVYGHGEVNPGHKEADEGMTIVNAIRGDRARQSADASKKTDKPFDPETMAP
jgi:hypothetical protein